MKIAVMRHGRVRHRWKSWCTSREYDEQCRLYDEAPLADRFIIMQGNSANPVYISTLRRSEETAKQLFGDVKFVRTKLIDEVPLRSAFDTNLKLPVWFWNVAGRVQWYFGSGRQEETRKQTRERAEEFAMEIIRNNQECAVVTHRFFMLSLIPMMEKLGFKNTMPRRGGRFAKSWRNIKNGQMIVFKK